MSVPAMFLHNFFRFDFLIFLLAAVEAYFFLRCRRQSRQIQRLFFPSGHLAGGEDHRLELTEHYQHYWSAKGELEILEQQRRFQLSYALYENICALFPLMGILGTVASLIPMVQASTEESSQLFFAALTSTFWGIIFAIIFKAANGWLAAVLEQSENAVDLYLSRRSQAKEKADGDEDSQRPASLAHRPNTSIPGGKLTAQDLALADPFLNEEDAQ